MVEGRSPGKHMDFFMDHQPCMCGLRGPWTCTCSCRLWHVKNLRLIRVKLSLFVARKPQQLKMTLNTYNQPFGGKTPHVLISLRSTTSHLHHITSNYL